MKEITVKVYKLEELNKDAQNRAIEDHVKFLRETFDVDFLTEILEDKLRSYGYSDVKASWSLSYSQGDGVAFYGDISNDDIFKLAKRLLDDKEHKDFIRAFNLIGDDISLKIEKNSFGHRYSHWNTMEIENNTTYYWHSNHFDKFKKSLESLGILIDYIKNDIKFISKELESFGYGYIEESTSEEKSKRDLIEGNALFYDNGQFYEWDSE